MLRTITSLCLAFLVVSPATADLQLNRLDGFNYAGAVRATGLSFITSTSSVGSATVTAPATIEKGDLLLLADYGRDSGAGSTVIPTGFSAATSFVSGNTGFGRFTYKIADGTEDGATITGQDMDTADNKVLMQFRATNGPIVALKVGTSVGTCTSANPAQQTNLAAAGHGVDLGFVYFGSSGVIDPRTTSITPTGELNAGGTTFHVQYYIQTSAPASYTWDMDDEGTANCLVGSHIHDILVAR